MATPEIALKPVTPPRSSSLTPQQREVAISAFANAIVKEILRDSNPAQNETLDTTETHLRDQDEEHAADGAKETRLLTR